MEVIKELIAWADKWNISYELIDRGEMVYVEFESCTWSNAQIAFNRKTGSVAWYGGD